MENKNKKVVLGMSGGVDSSVAALLLQQQGYEVVGMFMNCNKDGQNRWPTTISWEEEESQIKKICDKLGIDFIVKDTGAGYEKKVIGKMFEDYSKGLTPNPDILCNNVGKFPLLCRVAEEVGADNIATGHYVRVKEVDGETQLLKGKDPKKDQSYFLVGLPQEILEKCIFPIGDLTKDDVREIAKENGFENWDKRGSKGICYLGNIDVKEFLHSRIEGKTGNLLDQNGEIIGTHPGIEFFTIGERVTTGKDVEMNKIGRNKYSSDKLFVASKDLENNLFVAPFGDSSLKRKKIVLKFLNLVDPEEEVVRKVFDVRIRHLGELYSGRLEKENEEFVFILDEPLMGIAPGQSLVLYDGERLVGGGEIEAIRG